MEFPDKSQKLEKFKKKQKKGYGRARWKVRKFFWKTLVAFVTFFLFGERKKKKPRPILDVNT